MTNFNASQSLPKTAEVYHDFPRRLITPLRNIVDSNSAKEALGNYCSLFDVLLGYLANIGNSIYVAQPLDAAQPKIERRLREVSGPLALGDKLTGIEIFAAADLDLDSSVPELRQILTEQRLPERCNQMSRAFAAVRKGCMDFSIPPTHLPRYIDQHLAASASQSKCSIVTLCKALLPIRNKGYAHLDEDSWFPNNPRMFALVCEYLGPAVDELLTWPPMKALLTNYEVVEVLAPASGNPRASPIARVDLADGRSPLRTSALRLGPTFKPDKGARFLSRRTSHAGELEAVVRYIRFPKALESSDLLAQRYAGVYLHAYLDRGLITPTQRQTKLAPTISQLALPERDWRRVESELQGVINLYSSDDPELRQQNLTRLQAVLGTAWPDHEASVETLLEELPERREDYIHEQIENNSIMSFADLRIESELSEPDLDTVLAELEQQERVRQINTGVGSERLNGYFKVQDPGRATQLRGLLDELRERRRSKKGYPAPVWRLVELCARLLADDGLALQEGELEGYAELFTDDPGAHVAAEDDDARSMVLYVGDNELRADNVRELLTLVWEFANGRGLDTDALLPMLLGRSRYLVARTPEHANGTAFATPIEVGEVVFEGNMRRNRALAEAIRLLGYLGIEASSPEIEPARRDFDEGEEPGHLESGVQDSEDDLEDKRDEAPEVLMIEITAPGAAEATKIEGSTVRRFFASLLTFLVDHNAPLADIAPVATGRVRYFLAEEPYHRNDRRFDSMIEREGYFINTAYTYAQALSAAKLLADKLGWPAQIQGRAGDDEGAGGTPLTMSIGDLRVEAPSVPQFLREVITTLFATGTLSASDVPYKSGRVRYLIAETPTHDHGRDFIRPIEIESDGRRYFIEANVSRQGALDLVERLVASKQSKPEAD